MADNMFADLDAAFGITPQEDETDFNELDQAFGLGTEAAETKDVPPNKPIDKTADEMGSRYWEGMGFEEAMDEYQRIKELPNSEVETFSRILKYTDTETGRSEIVPMPEPAMFSGLVESAISILPEGKPEQYAGYLARLAGLDVAEDPDGMAFSNPRAKVGTGQLFNAGVRESVDDGREMIAAFRGDDKEVERLQLEGANIDTEDSMVDGLISDGGPAVVSALLGDKGASKVLGPAVKIIPKVAKNLARLITSEAAAVSTVGTDEGTVFIGEDAAIPVWQGLDLGDSSSQQVIEQRVNAFTEALGISSVAVGVGSAAATGLGGIKGLLVDPIVAVLGPDAIKEKAIFKQITADLASITDATTDKEYYEIINEMADTVEANSTIFIKALDGSARAEPLKIDTLNALIRGIDDPNMQSEARKMLAGLNTKGGKGLTESLNRPKQMLDQDVKDYLASVDAETPAQQTAAMQGTADEFTNQANEYVDQARLPAERAELEYNNFISKIGTGIAEDLEFADRLKQLETVTGTDIATAKTGKLNEVMDGVRLGYEDLSNQKNSLYNVIDGGDIDADALFTKVFDLNDDQISAAMSQVRRSSPLKNMLDIVNVKTIEAMDDAGDLIQRAPTEEERLGLFRDALDAQGADFGYIYNTIRPELSALASDLYTAGNGGAGKVVRDIVRFIDDDMVTFVENSDPALADAARQAKTFYKDTFAPIFSGEGVMADFADLYTRTVGRTDAADITATGTVREFDAAGFEQGAERISKQVLAGGMVGDSRQMIQALEVASDPNAMADYMVLDVLDKYAADIRINGLDNAKLTGMSGDLQQYASQLNELFPEKAAQITQFVSQIEEAARSKGNLEGIVGNLETTVKQARNDIAQTELMGFLRTELGNAEFLPTSNPQAAFQQLFTSKEGVASVGNINLAIQSLPPERVTMVRRGLEVAYMRQFTRGMSDFRAELGGVAPLKEVPIAKAQQEFDNILRIGREVFSGKPEVMDALEATAEIAGFVQGNRNSRTSIGLSPTAFLKDASKSTNRMIMSFIGPLSRLGARVRAGTSALFEAYSPDRRAEALRDTIFADADKFVELARKYNTAPNDREAQERLSRFLTSGMMKSVAGVDEEDRGTAVDVTTSMITPTLQRAKDATDSLGQAIDYIVPGVDEQTEDAFK